MDLEAIKCHILSVIRQAGEIITTAHEIESGDNVSEKTDAANLVTVFDVRVQEFLIKEISAFLPEAYFFAEEKENDPAMLAAEYCFVIDPIDGTANFVHDYHHSAISVSMLSRGEVVFAAVYDPYLKELFHAVKGKGAFLNDTPISVSDRTLPYAIGIFGTAPYYKAELGNKTFRLCEAMFAICSDLRRSGSAALDLAYVAAGRCEFFFEYRLSPWDYAAGLLLITEAGGNITDIQGNPLTFVAPCGVIAANKAIYPSLLQTIQSC